MPFEKGHKLAPGGRRVGAGRKPEEWRRIVNRALTKAVPEEDIEDAFRRVSEFARSGNVQALALLLDRMIGKPVQREEHTGADGQPPVVRIELGNLSPEQLRALAWGDVETTAGSGADGSGEDPPA